MTLSRIACMVRLHIYNCLQHSSELLDLLSFKCSKDPCHMPDANLYKSGSLLARRWCLRSSTNLRLWSLEKFLSLTILLTPQIHCFPLPGRFFTALVVLNFLIIAVTLDTGFCSCVVIFIAFAWFVKVNTFFFYYLICAFSNILHVHEWHAEDFGLCLSLYF